MSHYSPRKYIDFSVTSCNHNVTEHNKFAVKNLSSSSYGLANPYKTYYNSMMKSTLREFKSVMDFGDKKCQVEIRAKLEAKPLNSSCHPTLRLQVFPTIRNSSILNYKGIILTAFF